MTIKNAAIAAVLFFAAIAQASEKKIADEKRLKQEFERASRTLLVLTDGKTARDKIAAGLPGGFVIIVQQDELFMVSGDREADEAVIKAIRRIKGVVGVKLDEVIGPRDDNTVCKECELAGRTKQNNGQAGMIRKLVAAVAAAKCRLSDACKQGGAKNWAHTAVDADLMKKKGDELLAGKTVNAKVAVVDSGFDKKQTANMDVVGPLVVRAGVDSNETHPVSGKAVTALKKNEKLIGALDADEDGHGTMVASVIGARGDMGFARSVSLAVYRATSPGNEGTARSAVLEIATLKACRENKDPSGITVINLSWGGRKDEAGIERDEDKIVTRALMQKYAAEGCLIVKAAGNSAFRRKHAENIDDPYLRVAATDESNELADFSSTGEVSAPGARMYVLESTTVKEKAKKEKRCNEDDDNAGSPKTLTSGTSFAAPLVAALASQVVRVLKAQGGFDSLPPANRISLVNRIIKASVINGTVNGLRAVLLAAVFCKKKSTAAVLPDSRVLAAGLDGAVDPVCTRPAGKCAGQDDCAEAKKCFDEGRYRLAVCAGKQSDVAYDLADLSFTAGAYENGIRFMRYFKGSGDTQRYTKLLESAKTRYLKSIGYKAVPAGDDYSYERSNNRIKLAFDASGVFYKNVVLPYLEGCIAAKSCASGLVGDFLHGAVNSSKLISALELGVDRETGEDRGSADALGIIKKIISISRAELGDAAVSDRIKNLVDDIIKDEYRSARSKKLRLTDLMMDSRVVAAARIIDALIVRAGTGENPWREKLKQEELRLLAEVMKRNDYYGDKTQKRVILFEKYPNRSSFDGMISRNTDFIDAAVKSQNFEPLAPVQVHYLLRNIGYFGARTGVYLSLLDSVLSGRGWGSDNDAEIMREVVSGLDREIGELKKKGRHAEAGELYVKFKSILDTSVNLGVGVEMSYVLMRGKLKHLGHDLAFGLSRRVLDICMNLQMKTEPRECSGSAYVARKTLEGMFSDIEKNGDAARVQVAMTGPGDVFHRFSPVVKRTVISPAGGKAGLIGGIFHKIADETIRGVFLRKYDLEALLETAAEKPAYARILKQTGAWSGIVKILAEDIKKNPNKYTYRLKEYFEKVTAGAGADVR